MFVASTADGPSRSASWRKTSRFTSSRSTTASMTRSAPASGSHSLVGVTFRRSGVGLVARHHALARGLGRERLDLLHPARDDLVVDVLHDHGNAVERDELRDARAHRPGPDDRDLSHRRGRVVARNPGDGLRARSRWRKSSIRLRAAGVKTTAANSSRSAAKPAGLAPPQPGLDGAERCGQGGVMLGRASRSACGPFANTTARPGRVPSSSVPSKPRLGPAHRPAREPILDEPVRPPPRTVRAERRDRPAPPPRPSSPKASTLRESSAAPAADRRVAAAAAFRPSRGSARVCTSGKPEFRLGVVAGDAVTAGERELQPAAQTRPVDDGDGWARQPLDAVEQLVARR